MLVIQPVRLGPAAPLEDAPLLKGELEEQGLMGGGEDEGLGRMGETKQVEEVDEKMI